MERVRWYGFDKRCAGAVRRKAFEICEYGHQPTEEAIRLLFSNAGTTVVALRLPGRFAFAPADCLVCNKRTCPEAHAQNVAERQI